MKVRSHIYIKHASSKLEVKAIKKVGHNWFQEKPKSGPRGLQMTLTIEVRAQWPLDCAWEASETRHGRPWGGQAGGEREPKVLSEGLPIHSNTLLDAKVVLERLWNVYEVAFGSVFEGMLQKNDMYKNK